MGRALIMRLTAWGFRRGLSEDQMRASIARAVPHRDTAWRDAVITDARQRNRARLLRRIGA